MKTFIIVCLVLLPCAYSLKIKDGVIKKAEIINKNSTQPTTPNHQLATTSKPPLQGFRLPCSCFEGQCGCCTGVILDRFNQKACLNISYEPDDFALTTVVSMNKRIVFRRRVSGKNPPPMCFNLPRLSFIRFCMTFSNVYLANRNIHLCIDMEANWLDQTLLEWSFDCIRMGASGVVVVGPEEGGGVPIAPIDAVDQTDEDYDDSARNVVVKEKNDKTSFVLILDDSLTRIDPKDADKALIKIKKLLNGTVVAYDHHLALN